MAERLPTGFRLDPETIALLDALADRYGVTRTATLRFIVREAAQRAGLEMAPMTPQDFVERVGRKRRQPAEPMPEA